MVNTNGLRKKAEEILRQKETHNEAFSQMDVVKLVEELSIYQIELEHQNHALRESQDKLLQVKERYADLFNFAPLGYIILDDSDNIIDVNHTACNILNTDSAKLVNTSIHALLHPEYRETFKICKKHVIDSSKPGSCDVKMRKPGGSSFFARINIVPDTQSNNDNQLFRLALSDISIEKELEKKLLSETENAKKSDKLKSIFLANVGHEIRTPLNGILGFSNLMIDGENDPGLIKVYAEIINKNGIRLLQLINNILDISQIDSGNLPVKVKAFSPVRIIDNVVELFSVKATANNVRILKRYDEESVHNKLYSDPDKITQVLMNLLSNAIKFTKNGDVEIGYHMKDDLIIFMVKDTGIGIPEEAKEFLFDRFYQAENSLSGSDEGTGLGLAISKSIIELLDGSIWYKSELNKGSEFWFSVPVTMNIEK